jgi:site-specific recombinase XerD
MNPIAALGPVKKDGFCTVYLYVYIAGDRVKVNTHVDVAASKFDLKAGKVIGKTTEVKDLNLIIENCRARINEISVKFRLKNIDITAAQFRSEYDHPSYDIDFLAWMETEIKLLKSQVGKRRIIKYNTIRNKLAEFRNPITFSEIDRFFIEDYRGWCKTKKDNDISTISTNLNVIKTFTNRALRKGLIEKDPFADIRIGRGSVDRTFLTEEELRLFWNIYQGKSDIELKPHLRSVLRHFLFMCFTGLRISDFNVLCWDNVSGGNLNLYPIKTRSKKKQIVKIPLCEQANKLIVDEGFKMGKLFHPITEQRMNTNLKDIARLAEIKKPITNHSARHTFATLFIKKTSDVATLQRLLGHSRIEETMVYVHISEENLTTQMKKFEEGLKFEP